MKAKFDRSGTINAVYTFSCLGMVFGIAASFVSIKYGHTAAVLIITAIFAVAWITFANYHGKIYAREEDIVVVSTLFGKKIVKKSIDYCDLNSAECRIESTGTRYGNVIYEMILTITTADELEYTFLKRLDIEKDFPVSEPDKYKKYISEQPLMKISHYIDSKLHLNTSA